MDESTGVGLLDGLLRAYSPTLQEHLAVDFLADQMRSLGFTVDIDVEGSVSGTRGTGPNEILLLGHIDTAPGEVPVRREGDLLYGRGAVDAKGPLACFTAAAADAPVLEGWRVTVIGAVGEEGDSRGAKAVRDRCLASGRLPLYCLIGEPSRWDGITLGYKGSAWFEYSTRRPSAHSAAQVESASENAVGFWNLLQEITRSHNQDRDRAFDRLTASLREMHSSHDGLEEQASIRFNLRLPPGLSVQGVQDLLAPAVASGELRLLDGVPCYRAEKNNRLVRAMLAAIRANGGKPGFVLKTGTSDMNIVGPAWEIPILAYGPGDSSLDHTPDEHISIAEYLAAIRVLAGAIVLLQS